MSIVGRVIFSIMSIPLLVSVMIFILPLLIECNKQLPSQSTQNRILLSPEVMWSEESNRFMFYAFEKMGGSKCITFVSDEHLGFLVGSLSGCSLEYYFCTPYKYEIHYEGGNMSRLVMNTLMAGYNRRCSGYVILLNENLHVLQFLEAGHLLGIINTRARFLIWNERNDKGFEGDILWEKFPNTIFFHSKPKKRQSGLLFTVRQLRWPVAFNSSESRVRVIEFWGDKPGENDVGQIWFYDKTTDMKNVTLRIVVVQHPPGVIKYTGMNGEVEYAGTEIQIVKSLAKIMKFSYEFQNADPETKWGGQVTGNGSSPGGREFYGAAARLIYGEADMGIGSFFILKHYLNHIDMSIPLEVACTSLMTPNPLPRPRYLALIFPFRGQLWLLVLAVAIFIGPLILYAFSSHHFHHEEHGVFKSGQHVVLTSFRIMSQVALHLWPKFWPIRMFIGWYWLFWFCVTSGYRAAMVSFLTIPLYEQPIDNTRDLADSDLEIGGWGLELQRIFFQHLQVNLDKRVGSILSKRYQVLKNLDEGISRVADGKYALYENVRFLKFIRMTRNLSKNGSPTMRVMKQCIVPVHIGFAYQKNSAITLTVNRYIRLFQESGLTKRWAQRLVTLTREYNRNNADADEFNSDSKSSGGGEGDDSDSSVANSNDSKKQKILSIPDLQGAVYILFMGLALSALIFGWELLYIKYGRGNGKLEAEVFQEMINKSKRMIMIGASKSQALDVRVRGKSPRKLKRPKKPPPFPYLE